LRSSLNSIHAKAALKEKYKAVPVGNFDKLNFSSRLNVRIRQNKTCLVELAAKDDSIFKPRIENINGTLYFSIDSTIAKENPDSIHMRISMPTLYEINALKGAKIHLESFKSDSLQVTLANGCVFSGNNNTLLKVSYKISGDALLSFKQPF